MACPLSINCLSGPQGSYNKCCHVQLACDSLMLCHPCAASWLSTQQAVSLCHSMHSAACRLAQAAPASHQGRAAVTVNQCAFEWSSWQHHPDLVSIHSTFHGLKFSLSCPQAAGWHRPSLPQSPRAATPPPTLSFSQPQLRPSLGATLSLQPRGCCPRRALWNPMGRQSSCITATLPLVSPVSEVKRCSP